MEFCCPLCDRSFPPDQVSPGRQTAECTSCEMSVLVHRVDGASASRPSGFAITRTPALGCPAVQLGDGLYRTRELARRPDLAITQELPRDSDGLLARAIVAGELFIAAVIALAAGASGAVTLCFTGALFVLLWSLVTARHARRVIRADHQGLHWPRVTWTSQLQNRTLPANDIAQLYVRDTSRLTQRWSPRFTLCARDRGGRDHAITELDTPEQAWWLEDRLERHLGLVDRAVAGEYRRQALPAGR